MAEQLALAADFPRATRDRWQELVSAVLAKSGVDVPAGGPEQALASTTYDGIRTLPLYTADDAADLPPAGEPGAAPFVRGATADGATATGWDVRQRLAAADPAALNAAVLADLANGTTSVWLQLGEGRLAVADLPRALDGVYLDLAPVALDAGADTAAAAQALLALAAERGTDPAELRGTLGADPIGLRARTGAAADLALLAALADLASSSPQLQVATVDGLVWSDAGAGDADELAIATAVGVAYLRALTDAGLPVEDALARLEFRFAVSADQFGSIAKLRAARRLWARVAELSGATPARGQRQHAVTAAAMLTRRDPWVNMLRTTIACFAAAVGGADAVTVLPFDSAIGESDDFARRIARNTQSILHDESSLARVIDAAGGSWYVESLTDALAQAAWERFTAIERAGGALAALDGGRLEEMIAATRARRAADLAHRRARITGVSEFAFLEEAPVTRPAAPVDEHLHRWAEPYEQLRDRAERAAQRPAVFLAALGPPAVYSGRAGFAANLFAAGGIAAETGTGSTEEIAAAFRAAGTPLAVVCSSDKLYAEAGAEAVRALRDAGARRILVAGQADIGADGKIFAGCDALAVLRESFELLEEAR